MGLGFNKRADGDDTSKIDGEQSGPGGAQRGKIQ